MELVNRNLGGLKTDLFSKCDCPGPKIALECVNLSRDIELIEKATGTNQTIVIGDFNMNPYESGMVAANRLHALPDSDYIDKRPRGRKTDGISYEFFGLMDSFYALQTYKGHSKNIIEHKKA